MRRVLECFHVQVSKFSGRFKTIPDMLEADHLTVSGDVTFGKDVSLKVSNIFNILVLLIWF